MRTFFLICSSGGFKILSSTCNQLLANRNSIISLDLVTNNMLVVLVIIVGDENLLGIVED